MESQTEIPFVNHFCYSQNNHQNKSNDIRKYKKIFEIQKALKLSSTICNHCFYLIAHSISKENKNNKFSQSLYSKTKSVTPKS